MSTLEKACKRFFEVETTSIRIMGLDFSGMRLFAKILQRSLEALIFGENNRLIALEGLSASDNLFGTEEII